jgi:hypothetical protein
MAHSLRSFPYVKGPIGKPCIRTKRVRYVLYLTDA